MECRASCVPRPNIMWMVDDKPVAESNIGGLNEQTQNVADNKVIGTLVVSIDSLISLM